MSIFHNRWTASALAIITLLTISTAAIAQDATTGESNDQAIANQVKDQAVAAAGDVKDKVIEMGKTLDQSAKAQEVSAGIRTSSTRQQNTSDSTPHFIGQLLR